MFRVPGQKKRWVGGGCGARASRPHLSGLTRKFGSRRLRAGSLNTRAGRPGNKETSAVARVVSQSYNQATVSVAHRIPTRCVSEGTCPVANGASDIPC